VAKNFKYEAVLPDGQVAKRGSAREYSAAWSFKTNSDSAWRIGGFSRSAELAAKAGSAFGKGFLPQSGYQSVVVEAKKVA
jgi:hypothetical protein